MSMNKIKARVVSVYLGVEPKPGEPYELAKELCPSLQAELDGFVGDRHKSISRETWEGDKQPKGTMRRNERHWSAVSTEELVEITQEMDLKEPLTAASLGANLCLTGVPHLSRLPKGTTIKFPSGAELLVEEYNPPCTEMAQKIASMHTAKGDQPLRSATFSKAAKYRRGVVGVVEVAGAINAGDEVTVEIYVPPKWIARLSET
jgi:MOSC domain-containing protein YiiM